MLPRPALTGFFAAFLCTAPLFAQSLPPEPDLAAPAHVSRVDGVATLEREGRADNSPLNMPLLSGDRLRTGDGRVEVQFADGSTLHLDSRSSIDVQSDDLVRLTEGRLRLNIPGPFESDPGRGAGAVAYRIDSPAGSARITQPGEYRIALLVGTSETQLELAVLRGGAEVFTEQGTTPVRAGQRAYASAGLAPSYAYSYNSANWDAFDRWSEERRDVRLGASSQYLPPDLQSYAPLLDEGGDWRYTQSYGYAWYPRVASDWRPYYNGRWDSYPRYGWTWIGADRFAWPTHHYGRWGLSAGVWFWIPSSRWAPAYVSWAYAPGYVSWCPLGFDNRPILAIDLYRAGPGFYSPWRAWTSLSYSNFGRRDSYVNHRAVNWDRVDRGQRPRFETRASAPASGRDIAVPRAATPIHWAGSRSVPPRGENSATARSGARVPAVGTRSATSPAPARDSVTPRSVTAPRYINRGDEIVRSATERPTPRVSSDGMPARDALQRRPVDRGGDPARRDTAVLPQSGETRTVPEGPARPGQPAYRAAPPEDRAMPRAYGYPQPQGRPTSGDNPVYHPADRGAAPSSDPAARQAVPRAEPRTESPQGSYSAPVRQSAPVPYERARPDGDAPQRYPSPERAAPERAAPGRAAPERSPNRGDARQAPPPQRAAPAERQPPAAGAAVPRPPAGAQGTPSRPEGRRGRGGA